MQLNTRFLIIAKSRLDGSHNATQDLSNNLARRPLLATFETYRRALSMFVYGVDRKWPTDCQNGAFDPFRTCDRLDLCRKIACARPAFSSNDRAKRTFHEAFKGLGLDAPSDPTTWTQVSRRFVSHAATASDAQMPATQAAHPRWSKSCPSTALPTSPPRK